MSTHRSKLNFIIDFFSGGTAGVAAKTLSAPFERIKLLLQTANLNLKLKTPYQGVVDCGSRCIRDEGFFSLWRGNWVNVVRYFPTQAMNFSFKDMFQRYFQKNQYNSPLTTNLLAGGLAGCMSNSLVHPLDLSRTRIGVELGRKASERQFRGLSDTLQKIYRKNGYKGLYQGFGVSLFGIFIYRGLYFGLYDTGKAVLQDKKADSFLTRYLFANLCVITSESISYPTDTIKRKLMVQAASGRKVYVNSFDCIRQVMEKEGFSGFMRGNSSNILRSIGSSLCLVLYDEIQKITCKIQTF